MGFRWLWTLSYAWQFNPRSWTSGCAPSTSTPSPHTRTTQAANKGRSTRRYELMLRSMKLVTSESLGSITPIAPVDSPRKSRKRKAKDQIVPTGDSPLDRWLRSPPSAATAGGSGKVRKAPPGSPTPTGPKVKRVRL
ncbi:hypothetical protein CPC08DRAFT_126299 [Agrocybe pediades]|nr:hypothetical protein CPC08DRAFT_126299 [Agrocybe pediades]